MIFEGSRVIPRAPGSHWSSQGWSLAVVKSHPLVLRVTESEGKGPRSNSFELFSQGQACCRSSQVAPTRYLRSNTASVQQLPPSRPAPSGNYSPLLWLMFSYAQSKAAPRHLTGFHHLCQRGRAWIQPLLSLTRLPAPAHASSCTASWAYGFTALLRRSVKGCKLSRNYSERGLCCFSKSHL